LWAKVLVLNATAVHPAAAGTITFFPAGTVEPLVSSLAVSPGITRSIDLYEVPGTLMTIHL